MLERVHGQRALALACQSLCDRQHVARHGKRHDLDCRDQVFWGDDCVIRQRADGDGLIDRVQPVDAGGIDAQQAWNLGREVDPAGGGTGPGDQRRDQRRGQAIGGNVFRDVPRFQSSTDYLRPARRS